MVSYDGDLPDDGLCGYVFFVLVTGLRRGGWEPDIGAFFLEHPPHCGQWPVHYSKSMTWQLLLSTALGPAFCVCQASYATVRHASPFHRSDLTTWPLMARRTDVQRGIDRGAGVSDETSEDNVDLCPPLSNPFRR